MQATFIISGQLTRAKPATIDRLAAAAAKLDATFAAGDAEFPGGVGSIAGLPPSVDLHQSPATGEVPLAFSLTFTADYDEVTLAVRDALIARGQPVYDLAAGTADLTITKAEWSGLPDPSTGSHSYI